MIILYGITAAALIVSFIFSREKTLKALKLALKKFLSLLPPFFVLIVLIAPALYFIPQELIAQSLGEKNLIFGIITASVLGSIAFIPGFIVFPLCGILRQQNVPYMVLSAFTTSLMMVGVLTFPLEREYLGTKLAIARNIGGFFMAMIVALITGIFFGELSP